MGYKSNYLELKRKFLSRIKSSYLTIFMIFLFTCLGKWSYGAGPDGQGINVVVIDAGHGGSDPGCHGAMSNEKDVALAISLKLGKLIEERLPEVKVIYTRKTDVFLELSERAEIANKHKADLFICIHANAATPAAYGTETHVMGLDKANKNLEVAKRENSVMLLEENYETRYSGFDPNSDEDLIALTLMQSAYLNHSLLMAAFVQKSFYDRKRKDRGVKQAPYWVLHQTAMPSVLIEAGFLTNKEEEKYLTTPKSQDEVAEDIFTAFKRYKLKLEGKIEKEEHETETEEKKVESNEDSEPMSKSDEPEEKSTPPNNNLKNLVDKIEQVSEENVKKAKEDSIAEDSRIKEQKRREEAVKTIQQSTSSKNINDEVDRDTIVVEMPAPGSQNQSLSVEKRDSLVQELQIGEEVKTEEKEIVKRVEEGEQEKEEDDLASDTVNKVVKENKGIVFRVQIKTSSIPLENKPENFYGLTNVWEYQSEDGLYKYTVGQSDNPKELIYLQNSMRKKGCEGAFVAAFKDNKRISMKEALKK